jgi:outer membrane protein OmpA-like peptidoglycan-associated protein
MRDKMQEAQQAITQTRAQAERSEDETEDRVHAFYESLTGLDARLTKRGLMVNLTEQGLRFPSGSATLPDDAMPVIDEIAAVLKQRPQLSATIEGHTDSSGNAEINQRLSAQRASAVLDALVERGVDGSRFTTEGVGSADPVADNATAAGRERNRRVELYLQRPETN